jgi:hypothetical protein
VQRVDGGYRVNLGRTERLVLGQAFDDLRVLLSQEDPSTHRLFPTAYVDEPALEAEYRRLVGDDLVQSRLEAIAVVERTADGTVMSLDELESWMRAVNAVRLVIGTRLDIGEDDGPHAADDPDLPLYALYDFLGFILGSILQALSDTS